MDGGTRYRQLYKAQLMRATTDLFRCKPFTVTPIMALNTVLLYLSGYPLERVIGVGSLYAIDLLVVIGVTLRTRGRLLGERGVLALMLTFIGLQTGVVALTGGLTSPFVPILLIVSIGGIVGFGRSRESVILLAVVAAATALLALLPSSILVPVPSPYNVALAATTLLVALFHLWRAVTHLTDAYRSAGGTIERMREDVACEETWRARTLESLSSKVAHELKNPLAAIKGLTQLLERGAADARSKERLSVIAEEVTRMESILRDYLSFSRPLEELQPERVLVGSICDEVVAVLEARALAAGVQLSRNGNGATVVADPRRLKAAVLNLVSNALEATGVGGSIEVSVEPREGGAEIRIEDTGKGMSEEVLARIGTPFFTTRDEGTGLGVVLARAAVRQHGGEIAYLSEVGHGTTVTVRLPGEPPARGQRLPGCRG